MAAEPIDSGAASVDVPRADGRWWWHSRTSADPDITPEAHFIAQCVREPDAVRPGELAAAAAAVRDWATVVELARRHRVAAYILEAAARDAIEIPPTVARYLRRTSLLATATVLRIDVELRRVIGNLAAVGIPAVVLKGPALGRTIYPRTMFRPYGDIDLTVQDRHQAIAARTLLEQGYEEIPYAAEEARLAQAGHFDGCAAFHRQFMSGDGEVPLDLHADPLQLGLRPTGEAARWRRALPLPGLPGALMLCPEDQMVQLSAHVHKHGFDRLIWLKDLDGLLRTYPGRLDWGVVERAARDEGVSESVWYSLHLTKLLLGAPVPHDLLRQLRPSLPVRLLYGQVWPAARIAGLRGFMRRRAVQFHAAESWRGMLPSLILMGRRGARARAVVQTVLHS